MKEHVSDIELLRNEISACRLCADRFAATRTAHAPRPVVWLGTDRPRIVIAGQAPGARVHASGRPFTDPSGDRLRDWMGIDQQVFYDRSRIAILPMAFCFPGYDARGADLPPPRQCAATWRARLMDSLARPALLLLVGRYAMDWHLGRGASVRDRVAGWTAHFPHVLPLPHPSWRNTAWLKKNPWFEAELVPRLRDRVTEVLG